MYVAKTAQIEYEELLTEARPGIPLGKEDFYEVDKVISDGVEKNHTLFRDIVPKGKSFDKFTQDTVNLIFSHVNSVKRKIYKA